MVNTDTNELDEGDFAQYGWLIAGFFELVCQLNYKAGEIQYALKQDREQ